MSEHATIVVDFPADENDRDHVSLRIETIDLERAVQCAKRLQAGTFIVKVVQTVEKKVSIE